MTSAWKWLVRRMRAAVSERDRMKRYEFPEAHRMTQSRRQHEAGLSRHYAGPTGHNQDMG
ncbi:hypothetical protein [Actinacidiphila rubida]|uniref:Uncharacterized protein n=1 Tax=Actinacidiphila rubida TaxID=310780 RepID=A0A1H8NRP5_9ACTN|nr:hypothetical protein [Actinacidiphila rubida]SEO32286.1 hypothetical protein SAMN05216267_102354 [Actinacidiphila rubida]